MKALLVHGNAGSAATWVRVLTALAPRGRSSITHGIQFPGDEARAPALPGFGDAEEDPLPAGDPLDGYVAVVERAARELGGPLVLAGNGIGCVLAAHAALRLGDVVRGVVMTGPVGVPGGHSRLGFLSRSAAGAWALRVAGVTAIGRDRFLGDQLAAPRSDADACRVLCTALLRARGFHLLARLNRPASLAGLRALACPVVVLWGERDRVLPPSAAPAFLAHLPAHARLEIVPGASHALPLERPDIVAAALRGIAVGGPAGSTGPTEIPAGC